MSRNLLLVSLVLAMGVVLADDVPEVERAAGAGEAQAQTDGEAEHVAGTTEATTPS